MRYPNLNAMAALIAAATLAACGGGGGEPVPAGPAPAPAPAPGPAPAPPPPPPPPPPPAPMPPINDVRGSAAAVIPAGTTLAFNIDHENLITVDDPDSASLLTSLTVDAGTLKMAAGSGAVITGDETSAVTVSGTIAQINAALDGMVFTAPSTAQTVVLRIATQDESTPSPLSDTDEYEITVTAGLPPEFQMFQEASMVLGQPDFLSDAGGPPTARSLLALRGGVAGNGFGTLYVPDPGHNRVVVFPNGTEIGDPASFALGQPNLNTGSSSIDQGKHPQAAHVAIGTSRMAVAEPSANRVSLYYSVPTSGSVLPQSVLGQGSFTDSVAACFAARLNGPQSVAITPDGKLLVADTGNHRVNVYYAFPAPGEFAPLLGNPLGQANATDCLPNRGVPGTHAGTMNQPTGVWSDGTRIVVADTGNNRVLVWTAFPSESASEFERRPHLVLGQNDFSVSLPNRGGAAPGEETLNGPTYVASDGTRLAVADSGNHRVLIWTTFPTEDGQPADVVLGQSNFAKMLPNDSDQIGGSDNPSAQVFSNPGGLHFFRGNLYVTDRDNNRVLVFEPQ